MKEADIIIKTKSPPPQQKKPAQRAGQIDDGLTTSIFCVTDYQIFNTTKFFF